MLIYLKYSLKFLFCLVLVGLINSCSDSSKRITITSSTDCYVDSLVLMNKNENLRTFKKYEDTGFTVLINANLYNFTPFKLDSMQNLFGESIKGMLMVGNNWYYDRNSKPKNLIRIEGDSLIIYPFESSLFEMEGKQYIMQTHSYNSFIKLPNNEFITPILYYYDNRNVNTVKEYFLNSNQDRLGYFKIENNKIVLKKVINFFPRKDFFINESRCLRFLPTLCQNKNNFYLVYNFMDSIFCYDLKGTYLNSIKLPEELNFEHYDNSKDIYKTTNKTNNSELIGYKNVFMYHNDFENQIILVTLKGEKQDNENIVTPSVDDMIWFVSIYDINRKKWVKIIQFDNNHEFKNVLFHKRFIFVKRKKGEKLIFDKYAY